MKKMDGWMTCNFTSFLTIFQSYQDDVWIIKAVCIGTPVSVEKISSRVRIEPGELPELLYEKGKMSILFCLIFNRNIQSKTLSALAAVSYLFLISYLYFVFLTYFCILPIF